MQNIGCPNIKYTQLFINNEYVDSVSGQTFETINPSTGDKICDIQCGDKADVDNAVIVAQNAFKRNSVWRTIDASERGRLLYKLAQLIERDCNYISSLETLDIGMPCSASYMFVSSSIKVIRYYAGMADKIEGKTVPVDGQHFAYTRIEPIGVCGAIIPFNAPFTLCCMKLGPALAAGNVLVIKPPEQAPLSILYLGCLVKEAGIPAGVVNIITGYGATAGSALAEHQSINKITFTGSIGVGKLLQMASGKSNLKRVTLELGGKCPLVIFNDANIEQALQAAYIGSFTNSGQICIASSRIYVQNKIYDQFVERSVEMASKRVVGDPFSVDTEQGPQIDRIQFEKVLEYISCGLKEGARLRCGGKRFSEVTDSMTIAKEEIFGPVQCFLRFETMHEVIERCNDTDIGLAAYVFTANLNKALEFAHSVEAGVVWVNTCFKISAQLPVGGYKMSGIGRELGFDSIKEFVEIKSVQINTNQDSL